MYHNDTETESEYLLTIYQEEEGGCAGFYQQVFREEKVPFKGIAQLLLSIDEDIRAAGGRLAAERAVNAAEWDRPGTAPRRSAQDMPWPPKKGRTVNHFLITVHFCRNATWQGEVRWREKSLRRGFRSCLELSCMIADAVGGQCL